MAAAGAMATATRPHALLIPYPSSGHIKPTLHLARLPHSAGVLVTFVNTEHNHALLLERGHDVTEEDGFRYEAIPDGLVPSVCAAEDEYSMALLRSVRAHCSEPLRELILRLNAPPVTCAVASLLMSFTLDVAPELGLPGFMLWATSTCGLACSRASS
jgi:hypothetical protein